MKLKDYLHATGLGQVDFSRKVGISHRTLMHILAGHDIKLSIAAKIETKTLGAVTCIELSQTGYDQPDTKKDKHHQQNEGCLNGPI